MVAVYNDTTAFGRKDNTKLYNAYKPFPRGRKYVGRTGQPGAGMYSTVTKTAFVPSNNKPAFTRQEEERLALLSAREARAKRDARKRRDGGIQGQRVGWLIQVLVLTLPIASKICMMWRIVTLKSK